MPDEIDGGIVRLRRWRLADEPALTAAVGTSRTEMEPWLPNTLAERARPSEVLAREIKRFDRGRRFAYAMGDGDEVVGSCSITLHRRATAEIGYWVRSDRAGAGLTTAAVHAATAAAFTALRGLARVELRCDPANLASARVAEKAGYEFTERRPKPATTTAQTGEELVFVARRPV
jgi:RimJ/RimL family protein N-acetyltransferase